jgi:hypothetical protein
LSDPRLVGKVAHVITTKKYPRLLSMMWREARKKLAVNRPAHPRPTA